MMQPDRTGTEASCRADGRSRYRQLVEHGDALDRLMLEARLTRSREMGALARRLWSRLAQAVTDAWRAVANRTRFARR